MKVVKYIVSGLLIVSGLSFVKNGNFISGLLVLILGGILLPIISEKIKKQIILFQNQKIRYGFYIALFIIGGVFMPKKQVDGFESKEDILINYIKNNNNKSLQNIKRLGEIGRLFGNNNYSLKHPHDGYISEEYDSVKKVSVLTFDSKFFKRNKNINFFKNDNKDGTLEDYLIIFFIDKKDSIISTSSIITFSKSGKKTFSNKNVPNIDSFFDYELIARQRIIADKKEVIQQEKIKFNEIMGNEDFWKTYDPMVKKRIYNLILTKDCSQLQKEFTISANRADTKHSIRKNADRELDFMGFIDRKKKEIGCYR